MFYSYAFYFWKVYLFLILTLIHNIGKNMHIIHNNNDNNQIVIITTYHNIIDKVK